MDLDSSSLKGFELGKLVLSSGLLHSSWSKISAVHESTNQNQDSGLGGIKVYEEAKHTLVVFNAQPIRSLNSASSSTLLSGSKDNPFHFLCSENISSFSLHTLAFNFFTSAYKGLSNLKSELLQKLKSKQSVIITGAALGGSIASLFTLWLLETIEPKLKRPLCITFGSPLIGDASLQLILENSVRNSCFLHVADAAQTLISEGFKPFGTFLICFGSQCICIEDPEAVMELLTSASTDHLVGWRDYGEVIQRLDQSSMADSRLMIDDGVFSRMEERTASKNLRFDQLKKLDDMKKSMMHIEWYKKICKERKMGYYDHFKTQIASIATIDVEKRKRELNDYWKSMVEEVKKKPQSEISNLKTRFVFAGNNYRRMIEPLDIAEYYVAGGTEYRASGRSRHYVMLEKWFEEKSKEESIEPVRCEKRDLTDFLTFDSCFWAKVEEVKIAVDQLKTQVGMMRDEVELTRKLVSFEKYVWEMIGKREVSPEIFLEKSSFMKWWKDYKEMKGRRDWFNSSASGLTEFMNSGRYESYGQFAGK